MNRTKAIFSLLLAFTFLAVQVISVGAAPAHQEETPATGTIDSITFETDPDTNEILMVVVTLTDTKGVSQTLSLSVEEATDNGLLITDTDGNLLINDDAINSTFKYTPTEPAPSEEGATTSEKQHPVGAALSDFFFDVVGVDYQTVMAQHDNGVGFGVLAQALWITNALEGNSSTFALILDAKQTKDYSSIPLPDGSTPTNWGQFRKAILKNTEQAKQNLGAVKSGHAGSQESEVAPLENKGNKPDKENGNGNKFKDTNEGDITIEDDITVLEDFQKNNGNLFSNNSSNSNAEKNQKNDKVKDKSNKDNGKGNDKDNNGKGKNK